MGQSKPHRLAHTPLGPITPHCDANLLSNNKPTTGAFMATSDHIEQEERGRERATLAAGASELVRSPQAIGSFHNLPIRVQGRQPRAGGSRTAPQ